MSKRIPTVTRQLIESAVLPVQTKTYTVISHKDVIQITEKVLMEKGFDIINDRYKCTKSAQVAQGVYALNYGEDPEMKMMFAWSNSYDKSLRFRCGVGGRLDNGAVLLSGNNLGSWARRHSGNALNETTDTIKTQISNAGVYYAQLVHDKTNMKLVTLTFKQQAEIAGRLFVELELVNTEQISEMKAWIKEDPTKNTLWDLYSYLVTALQKSHPAKWMDAQIAAHLWVCNEFNLPLLPVIPVPVQESHDGEVLPGPEPIPVPEITVHQVTLEESIAEIAKEEGIPETLDTGFQSLSEAVVIEKSADGAPLVSIEFGTLDLSKPGKPTATDLMEQIKRQASEVAEEFKITEDDSEPFQMPDPDQPHIFTAETDEAVECMICGKSITDNIHDSF